MNKAARCVLVASLSLMFAIKAVAATVISPVGTWATISDETKKKRAIVKISEQDHKLTGTIIKVFKEQGDTGMCHNCPKPFTGQKVAGLNFLWDLKATGQNTWTGGHILDPKTGKIYKAKLTMNKDGNSLFVRGYIGIPLLGRTQTWLKVS